MQCLPPGAQRSSRLPTHPDRARVNAPVLLARSIPASPLNLCCLPWEPDTGQLEPFSVSVSRTTSRMSASKQSCLPVDLVRVSQREALQGGREADPVSAPVPNQSALGLGRWGEGCTTLSAPAGCPRPLAGPPGPPVPLNRGNLGMPAPASSLSPLSRQSLAPVGRCAQDARGTAPVEDPPARRPAVSPLR